MKPRISVSGNNSRYDGGLKRQTDSHILTHKNPKENGLCNPPSSKLHTTAYTAKFNPFRVSFYDY